MMLAGVVLAGGRSSRMDGRDKALLPLGGETLTGRAVRRLSVQVPLLALSANGDAARFCLAGVDIVADGDDSRSGPLAGILAGLRWAAMQLPRPGALLSVAVDAPFFPPDLAARLAAATDKPDIIAVAACGGARHPTFALWPLTVASALTDFLAKGGRKVGAFIEAQPHLVVDFPAPKDFDPFFNINTPADLAEAEATLRRLT